LEYTKIERETWAFQQPVPAEAIEKMCKRAFGEKTEVVAARELGNGEYNNVYLLELAKKNTVILRVAPPGSLASRMA
jgi:hypothetical protein